MKWSADFEFTVGEEVKIKAIAMTGRVDSCSWDHMGAQYRVVYWNDGQRLSVWMYGWEIDRLDQRTGDLSEKIALP